MSYGGKGGTHTSISFVQVRCCLSSIRKWFPRTIHQLEEPQWARAGQAVVQRRLQAHLRWLDGRARSHEVVRGPRWGRLANIFWGNYKNISGVFVNNYSNFLLWVNLEVSFKASDLKDPSFSLEGSTKTGVCLQGPGSQVCSPQTPESCCQDWGGSEGEKVE